MTIEDKLIDRIQFIWGQLTDTELPPAIANKFLYEAVEEIEGLYFPTGVTYQWDDAQGKFLFTSQPSLISQVLYVYKALLLLEFSQEGRAIIDGGGITIKSGVNSISTDSQAVSHRDRRQFFENQFNSALRIAKKTKLNEDIGEAFRIALGDEA